LAGDFRAVARNTLPPIFTPHEHIHVPKIDLNPLSLPGPSHTEREPDDSRVAIELDDELLLFGRIHLLIEVFRE
jgi:hypothetical protein